MATSLTSQGDIPRGAGGNDACGPGWPCWGLWLAWDGHWPKDRDMCPCQHGCPPIPDLRSLSLPLDCDNTRTGPWMTRLGLVLPACAGRSSQCLSLWALLPHGDWVVGASSSMAWQGSPSHHPAAPIVTDELPAQPCLQAANMTWLGAEASEWRRNSSHLDGCLGWCLSPSCSDPGLCLHPFTGPAALAEPPGARGLR